MPNTPPLRKRTLCKKVRGGFIRLPLPRLLRHHFSGQLAGMKTAGGRIRNHRAHPPGNRAHGAGDRIRSRLLDTPQHYPRAGSQSYPSPAAEPDTDGSTTIFFGPKQPDGVKRGNWIQTMPGKGWFTILRLYSPLEPFFDKTWRPSEIQLVK